MKVSDMLLNASIEEMKKGYIEDDDSFTCLLCSKKIEKGIIYSEDNILYEAKKYMIKHIQKEHVSVFDYLAGLDKKISGISEHQCKLMKLFYEGKKDNEIQKELNIGSASTIRNHRFVLKEKERQAKIFLVMMELLKEKNKDIVSVIKPRNTARMVDDRYNITEDENLKILNKYFPDGIDGKLTTFSMQEKHKIIVLNAIIKRFDENKTYTEKEVNEILKEVYEYDYVAVRRFLIEYGFMDRKDDCSEYWVKKSKFKTDDKVISGVYQIKNKANGKFFITSARNISNFNGDIFQLNLGSYKNKPLQNEWKKYGEDSFEFDILQSFEESEDHPEIVKELKRLEREWILKLKPFGDKGYNKEI